mmetsp:Transcript_18608/g.58146  ORF Transcript_18608/g.58146 Transcript_18608/m.58146 type:complete len:92 (+) Transcript_18608:529-804(+)
MASVGKLCAQGRVEDARRLLDSGADVDAVDARLRTPLYLSCKAGHLGAARLLLDRGARPSSEQITAPPRCGPRARRTTSPWRRYYWIGERR